MRKSSQRNRKSEVEHRWRGLNGRRPSRQNTCTDKSRDGYIHTPRLSLLDTGMPSSPHHPVHPRPSIHPRTLPPYIHATPCTPYLAPSASLHPSISTCSPHLCSGRGKALARPRAGGNTRGRPEAVGQVLDACASVCGRKACV